MEEGQVLPVTDEKGKEIIQAEKAVEDKRPESPKIILELSETGAVNVSWTGRLGRIQAYGMLWDAHDAIQAHFANEAMKKEMLRQKLAKPGLRGFNLFGKK